MVLFTSVRPLERAENLKAVYDAYDGEKEFVQRSYSKPIEGMHSGRYSLMVTDGLIEDSPGKYLWIGHGMGAGKKIGLQHPSVPFGASNLVTCAIASSPEMIPIVAGFCGIPEERVIAIGMPRTDAYFKMQKKPHDKRQYLYVPTFRGYKEWIPEFGTISRGLTDDEEFIVKPHMVTQHLLDKERDHVIERSSNIPSTESLVDADVVITDFSSIMFDAMVLKKPVVLFAKDKFKYRRVRGMYCQYPETYSDLFCDNERELIPLMRYAKWTERMEEARKYFTGSCDGHSTERCIKLIEDMV